MGNELQREMWEEETAIPAIVCLFLGEKENIRGENNKWQKQVYLFLI